MNSGDGLQVAVAFLAVAIGTLLTELAKKRINVPPLFLSWIIGGLLLGGLFLFKLYPVTWDAVFDFVKIVAGTNAAYKVNLLYIKKAIRAGVKAIRKASEPNGAGHLGAVPPRITGTPDDWFPKP